MVKFCLLLKNITNSTFTKNNKLIARQSSKKLKLRKNSQSRRQLKMQKYKKQNKLLLLQQLLKYLTWIGKKSLKIGFILYVYLNLQHLCLQHKKKITSWQYKLYSILQLKLQKLFPNFGMQTTLLNRKQVKSYLLSKDTCPNIIFID